MKQHTDWWNGKLSNIEAISEGKCFTSLTKLFFWKDCRFFFSSGMNWYFLGTFHEPQEHRFPIFPAAPVKANRSVNDTIQQQYTQHQYYNISQKNYSKAYKFEKGVKPGWDEYDQWGPSLFQNFHILLVGLRIYKTEAIRSPTKDN